MEGHIRQWQQLYYLNNIHYAEIHPTLAPIYTGHTPPAALLGIILGGLLLEASDGEHLHAYFAT